MCLVRVQLETRQIGSYSEMKPLAENRPRRLPSLTPRTQSKRSNTKALGWTLLDYVIVCPRKSNYDEKPRFRNHPFMNFSLTTSSSGPLGFDDRP